MGGPIHQSLLCETAMYFEIVSIRQKYFDKPDHFTNTNCKFLLNYNIAIGAIMKTKRVGKIKNPNSDETVAVVVEELEGFAKLLDLFHRKFGHSNKKYENDLTCWFFLQQKQKMSGADILGKNN